MTAEAPLATGRAPGKVILFGEHAVVYGHPALAAAVGRFTTVRLFAAQGATHLLAPAPGDPRLARALALALPADGLRVEVESELPIGRGMGSSAALSVALVRAAARLAGEALDPDPTFARSLEIERVFHGNPSGVDNAVVARGGLWCFRRGPPLSLLPLAPPAPLPLVVLDSGSAGDTGALVAAVAARRALLEPVLDAIGALAAGAADLLGEPTALGAAMDENHALLGQLGVSTPALDALCALARRCGALGAKLSGAGGGGVVVALAAAGGAEALAAAARRAGASAFPAPILAP